MKEQKTGRGPEEIGKKATEQRLRQAGKAKPVQEEKPMGKKAKRPETATEPQATAPKKRKAEPEQKREKPLGSRKKGKGAARPGMGSSTKQAATGTGSRSKKTGRKKSLLRPMEMLANRTALPAAGARLETEWPGEGEKGMAEAEAATLRRKEGIVALLSQPDYKPLRQRELAVLLGVPAGEREAFRALVAQLEREGQVVESSRGKLLRPAALSLEAGTFLASQRGFGFIRREEEGAPDVFIPASKTLGAMHKDQVLFRQTHKARGNRGPEGEIVRITERAAQRLVGLYVDHQSFGLVEPDEARLCREVLIPKEDSAGAVNGQKVVVRLTQYPENGKLPRGEVVEILGHADDPGVDILSIIRQFDLPTAFPPEVETEILATPTAVAPEDLTGREDFRDWEIITIDGADAKDLDDAVSVEERPGGGFRLGVHIADVCHYVPENSPLDQEARERATSIYLADRVIPMLPHKLSNGICSLNPDTDRLTLSCIMDIDEKGKVTDSRIVESVIHSKARMTYENVKKILEDNDPALREQYREIVPLLERMARLRDILWDKRKRRGAIDFDLPESKVVLDKNGKPLDILPAERNVATSIIEEFMLVCNETVAQAGCFADLPFIFRSHEAPDSEKMERLLDFASRYGYHIPKTETLKPGQVARLLEQVKDKPEEHIMSRITLRSMQQARYTAENLGHFGLAAKYYCHFTSPIRRYPDQTIHRVIKKSLHGALSDKTLRNYERRFPDLADHCSEQERRADDAERATIALKKVEYMEDKVGQVYDGIISGVTGWGIFVELPNTVEGMIAVSSLVDDWYVFDEKSLRLTGERTKKSFQLGDPVTIQVERVDKMMRTIDFALLEKD